MISFLGRGFCNGWFWVGVPLMALSFYLLLVLLSWEPISLVIPASALSYVVGTLGAKYILKEDVNGMRWAGVLLVCVGVAIVAARIPIGDHDERSGAEWSAWRLGGSDTGDCQFSADLLCAGVRGGVEIFSRRGRTCIGEFSAAGKHLEAAARRGFCVVRKLREFLPPALSRRVRNTFCGQRPERSCRGSGAAVGSAAFSRSGDKLLIGGNISAPIAR